MNLLLSIGLQQIFGMISALQILILLPLLHASMPANCGNFFNEISKIAAFDIFEIGEYVDEYFNLDFQNPVNEKFESLGFESVYFINNLGTFVFWLLAYYLASVVWLFAKSFSIFSDSSYRLSQYLGGKIFWNTAISTVFESFLVVALVSMISLKHNYDYSHSGQSI